MAINPAIKEQIDSFVNFGRPPGSFVWAVLCNDLKEAFARADEDNRAQLFEIVLYLYNEVAASAWGSEERAKHWMAARQQEQVAAQHVDQN